jgi:hypothetical protein
MPRCSVACMPHAGTSTTDREQPLEGVPSAVHSKISIHCQYPCLSVDTLFACGVRSALCVFLCARVCSVLAGVCSCVLCVCALHTRLCALGVCCAFGVRFFMMCVGARCALFCVMCVCVCTPVCSCVLCALSFLICVLLCNR